MTVVFRADASIVIGSGHVMRCLALAGQLRRDGIDTHFVCRAHPGHLGEIILAQGHGLTLLPMGQDRSSDPAHASWLGASWEEDAAATADAVAGRKADWLIVDHYALDARWEGDLRSQAGRIMVIDDLADRPHDCDLLLDQNIHASPDRYRNLVPEGCRLFLGPMFALLRPEFETGHGMARPRSGQVRRVLIAFGGTDPEDYTGMALTALDALRVPGIQVDIVVGMACPHREKLAERCASRPHTRFFCQSNRLAELMAEADLAIGAGGAMTWERACLGLPAVVLPISANQFPISRGAASRRLAIACTDPTSETLPRLIAAAVSKPGLLRRISQRGLEAVDGKGLRRMTAALRDTLVLTLLSDEGSWLNQWLPDLVSAWQGAGHEVRWVHDSADFVALPPGDCAFLLSCSRILGQDELSRHTHNLVVHESDLPRGRGMSPLTWQILEGRSHIPVTLLEAALGVDRGGIYCQEWAGFEGHELIGELRSKVAAMTVDLCQRFVSRYPRIAAQQRTQRGPSTYYRRRTPENSRLDPDLPLRDQFNLLRVVDNERYPAFFELNGMRYVLRIEKSPSAKQP